jgi:hypothetical protein
MNQRFLFNLLRVSALMSAELLFLLLQFAGHVLLAIGGAGLILVGGVLLLVVLLLGAAMDGAKCARVRVRRMRQPVAGAPHEDSLRGAAPAVDHPPAPAAYASSIVGEA